MPFGDRPGRCRGMDPHEEQFTIDEAAAWLGYSPLTLRDQVTRREVPHHRRGKVKGVYFTRDDLDQIRSSQARPAQAATGVRKGARPGSTASRAPAVVPEEFARLRKRR